jgi:hypothetical protein
VEREEAMRLVLSLPGSEGVKFYRAQVDTTGIQVTVAGQEVVVPFM